MRDHRNPTKTCGRSNPAVRSSWDNVTSPCQGGRAPRVGDPTTAKTATAVGGQGEHGMANSVLVSQIWRAFASGPAGEIPPGESIVKRCWRPDLRPKCHLPCSAEKLGELGDPGFQARLFWKRLWGFFLVTDPPQGRQHIGERWFFLLGVPGPERKA